MTDITTSGYMGKILRVDLTTGQVKKEALDEKVARKFLGGSGLGIYYLYNEVSPATEWFDPNNRLIVMSGPLGATIGGSGGYSVITKGPMTNGASSSQGMGYWGAFLKTAGFDGLIIEGSAKEFVYLYIHDENVEIRKASHLLGKNTWETQESIEKELGKNSNQLSVVNIGPAGENLVRFACLVSDRGHVAAHNGVGAVMGAKKLKAIAVERGQSKVNVNDKKLLDEFFKQRMKKVKDSGHYIWRGTQPGYKMFGDLGLIPVKNYTTLDWSGYENLDSEYYRKVYSMKRTTCWACPFDHCHTVKITSGPYEGFFGEEPEYEAMVSYGPVIGNKDPAGAIVLGNETDWLGLDINEAGWVISWVMECYEEGVFTSKDTDNLEMTWGNIESARQLLRKIAHKEGIGSLLADGVMRAAVKIGGRAGEKAIYTKKGNTPRSHDHRTIWNTIIDTVTSSMGTDEASALLSPPEALGLPADTNRGSAEGAALINAATAKLGNKHLVDSMILCYLNTYGASKRELLSHLTAATGWPPEEFDQFGFMVNNLYRAFGIRHGHTREMDEPSPRYGSTSLAGQGKGKSLLPEWQEARRVYYESMGWDGESGKPLPETLRKLGLDFVISHIWG